MKPDFRSSLTVKRDRLSDQVARSLEAMMLSGELALGDALPSERDLMERYGVGRPAIREALLLLNKKGLLAVSGGERARVTAPKAAEMLENLSGAALMFVRQPEGMKLFQQTRLFTEAALVREAARLASAQNIRDLEDLLRANENATGNPAEFAVTDDAFHYGIALLSGNRLVLALYDSMLTVLQDQRRMTNHEPADRDLAVGYHRRILAAIRSADPDGAEREMRQHLAATEKIYWETRHSQAEPDGE